MGVFYPKKLMTKEAAAKWREMQAGIRNSKNIDSLAHLRKGVEQEVAGINKGTDNLLRESGWNEFKPTMSVLSSPSNNIRQLLKYRRAKNTGAFSDPATKTIYAPRPSRQILADPEFRDEVLMSHAVTRRHEALEAKAEEYIDKLSNKKKSDIGGIFITRDPAPRPWQLLKWKDRILGKTTSGDLVGLHASPWVLAEETKLLNRSHNPDMHDQLVNFRSYVSGEAPYLGIRSGVATDGDIYRKALSDTDYRKISKVTPNAFVINTKTNPLSRFNVHNVNAPEQFFSGVYPISGIRGLPDLYK